ncbi:MAG: hypothetical protein H8E68_01915 [Kiritimatiellaeota bacterium]|nr:hypothetical protein [Kiritimatiellota bacterium]
MISPDPSIQSPDSLQSFNRYSYCWNNPLSRTDPSGFSTESLATAVGALDDYKNLAEPAVAQSISPQNSVVDSSQESGSGSDVGSKYKTYCDGKVVLPAWVNPDQQCGGLIDGKYPWELGSYNPGVDGCKDYGAPTPNDRKSNDKAGANNDSGKNGNGSGTGGGGNKVERGQSDNLTMDGRIYDPVIGRMISPDPSIQSPDSLQSFNRYSYCWNNPLSRTDPSGFSTESLATAVGALDDYKNLAEPAVAQSISPQNSVVDSSQESGSGSDVGSKYKTYCDGKVVLPAWVNPDQQCGGLIDGKYPWELGSYNPGVDGERGQSDNLTIDGVGEGR